MNRSKLRRQIAWEAARLMYSRAGVGVLHGQDEGGPANLPGLGQAGRPAQQRRNPRPDPDARPAVRRRRAHRQPARDAAGRAGDDAPPRALSPAAHRQRAHRPHPRKAPTSTCTSSPTRPRRSRTCSIRTASIYAVERKQVRKHGEERIFTHIHVVDRFPFELTVYAADQAHYVFKSSITGKAIERASIAELEQFLAREYPDLDLDAALDEAAEQVDRFQVFESLLLPLENVKQPLKYHPEGDALYHSLQVFDHARDQLAYDEEFLLAALLHDVGKAIDPADHVAAGLEALDGFITERTAWLIEHHMLAHQLADGTLGARARRRLEQSEHFDDLVLLGECDRAGRQPGVEAPELDEALDYLRELGKMFG